jgi:hypothetical protein
MRKKEVDVVKSEAEIQCKRHRGGEGKREDRGKGNLMNKDIRKWRGRKVKMEVKKESKVQTEKA